MRGVPKLFLSEADPIQTPHSGIPKHTQVVFATQQAPSVRRHHQSEE